MHDSSDEQDAWRRKHKTPEQKVGDVNQEIQEKGENKMIHLLDEDSIKSWVEFWSKESDHEVGQRIENWMSVLLGVKEVDVERAKHLEVWNEVGG